MASAVRELDLAGVRLVDALAVVEVQLARRVAVAVRGDDDDEVLLPQLRRRVRRAHAHGHDAPALEVQRDGVEADVGQGDGIALPGHRCAGVEVVELVLREVDVDGGRVVVGHGRDHDAVAPEELVLQVGGVAVGRVLEEHGVEHRRAGLGLCPQHRVRVVEQTVANVDGGARGRRDLRSAVQLVRRRLVVRVVAEEGREGAEEDPARAQVVRRVAVVPADVAADHRDLEQRREFLQLGDRPPVVVPVGEIVAQPVADLSAGSSEGRPGNATAR